MKFQHQLRKDPLGWIVILVLLLTIVVALTRNARAHSWYDAVCCADHDCEPVVAVSYVASEPKSAPVMLVTTSLGTKPVMPETKILDSRDSRMHACIYRGKLVCLYMPPSD
jgi:hypothetical protein